MADAGKSSKGVTMYVSKGTPVMVTVTPTAITKAKPTQVTAPVPTGTITAYKVGQFVYCRDTGFPELDSRYFVIGALVAGGFSMTGADTTNSTGTLGSAPRMDIYEATDFLKFCLNNYAFSLETGGSINVGTYCNPTASIASSATGIGTATLGGWIDKDDAAYGELLKANDDGLSRIFSMTLPLSQGYIVAPMTITSMSWDVPIEGGMAFNATSTLTAKPRHLF